MKKEIRIPNIDSLVSDLLGTNKSIEYALFNEFPGIKESDINADDLSKVKSEIAICHHCNLWSEKSEMATAPSGEIICDECFEDLI